MRLMRVKVLYKNVFYSVFSQNPPNDAFKYKANPLQWTGEKSAAYFFMATPGERPQPVDLLIEGA